MRERPNNLKTAPLKRACASEQPKREWQHSLYGL
jgi:hypothetical protein